ncbi:MAG: asparagine synthase-related protein, partial [Bacteroidota bacterium]
VKEAGIKVILCGQGADEYMGGYGQWEDMQFLRCNSIWSLLKQRNFRALIRYIYLAYLQFTLFKKLINKRLNRNSRIFNFSRWNVKRRHILDQFNFNLWEVAGNINYFIFHAALPKYLHWEDRNSMANSVEARVPFLNHELVELYSSLGEEDLLCSDRKGVFKDAIKDLLPEEIYYRRDKKGFVNSEQLWVKEVDTEFFRTKLEIGLDRIGDRIQKKAMLKDFDLMVLGKRPFDYQFWRIIIFGEWMSVFGIDFSKKN